MCNAGLVTPKSHSHRRRMNRPIGIFFCVTMAVFQETNESVNYFYDKDRRIDELRPVVPNQCPVVVAMFPDSSGTLLLGEIRKLYWWRNTALVCTTVWFSMMKLTTMKHTVSHAVSLMQQPSEQKHVWPPSIPRSVSQACQVSNGLMDRKCPNIPSGELT